MSDNDEYPRCEHPFDLPDDRFAIPHGIEAHFRNQFPRTIRAELYRLGTDNEKFPVNTLYLRDDDKPSDAGEPLSYAEFIQMLVAMANVDVEDRPKAAQYRVAVSYFGRDNKVHGRSFTFNCTPPGTANPGEQRLPHIRAPLPPHMDERSAKNAFVMQTFESLTKTMGQTMGMIMSQFETSLGMLSRGHSEMMAEHRKQSAENRVALQESRKQTRDALAALYKTNLALAANNEHQEKLAQRSSEMFQMGWKWYMYSMHQNLLLQERRHKDELERLREDKQEANKFGWLKELGPGALGIAGAVLKNLDHPLADLFTKAGVDMTADGADENGFTVDDDDEEAEAPEPAAPEQPAGPDPKTYVPDGDWMPQTIMAKAHMVGELFSAKSWRVLEEAMSTEQFSNLQSFVTSSSDLEACQFFAVFTQSLRKHAPGSDAFDGELNRRQVMLAVELGQQMEELARPPSPAPPEQPRPPSPPMPPMAPHSPPPGPAQPEAHSGAAGSDVIDTEGVEAEPAPVDEDDEPSFDDIEELDSALKQIHGLSMGCRTEIVRIYGSVASVLEAGDELLELQGVGPKTLEKIRSELE